MNEQFLIYLWSISSSISDALVGIGVLGGVFGFIGAGIVTGFILDGNLPEKYFKCWIVPLLCVILGFSSILIPSKQDLALIWAYPTVKQGVVSVVNNKQVQAVPDKILRLANKYLDEQVTKKD